MRRFFLLFTICFCAIQLAAQIYEPIKWHFDLKPTSDTEAEIVISAKIDKGWHLYGTKLPDGGPLPTSVIFEELNNITLVGPLRIPGGLIEEYDPNFDMKLGWYKEQATFVQKVTLQDKNYFVSGYVEFMACNDKSCLPPAIENFSFGDTSKAAVVPPTATPSGQNDLITTSEVAAESNYWTPVVEELQAFGKTGSAGNTSLWWIFIGGLLGGFLALLTPCVWPIIPMTVSFFLKRSEKKAQGKRDAIFYGIAIIVIYLILGLLITLLFGASALNSLSTNAIFNLFFFVLLVVFAISFFGAFEITLPSSWSTKIDSKAEKTGGILGILMMAFTLALVSFSCTGPIIGTLLVEVAGTGSILAPAVGMFGFAVALALPFSIFALFPSMLKSMPRSGGWLGSVKVVLAFLELALALKFLSVADLAYGWGILDREVFISLWIVIFALLGLYLLGKLPFSEHEKSEKLSIFKLFLAIVSLSFAVYMVPGLWGAPLKSVSAFAPPLNTQDFNLYENEVHVNFDDFETGMRYAKEKGKPVIIDFSGYGCVNCRKMEATVWTDAAVAHALNNDFVLITLYVDDKKPLSEPYTITENGRVRNIKTVGDKWSYLQRSKFGANAQPFYVMLNNEGYPINSSYAFDESPANFLKWLNSAK